VVGVRCTEVLEGCVTCGAGLRPFDAPIAKGVPLRYEGCPSCGLVQMNPRPDAGELDRFYASEYRVAQHDEDGQTSAGHQEARADNIRAIAGLQPRRHLDVGCSTGILLAAFGAPEQVGIEPGEQHRALALDAGIEVHETLEALAATEPEPFDLITISHVLEHVPDPIAFLTTASSVLADEGRIVIEVPNLYGSRSYEVAHLLCFTLASLTTTLGAAGLDVERSKLHSIPKGGRGAPKAVTVVAVAAEARPAGDGTVDLRTMHRHRTWGRAPETVPRWAGRQRRRIARRARGIVGHRG